MTHFKTNVARVCGMNAAIVSQYLWERLKSKETVCRYCSVWTRASMKSMTISFPFLTERQIGYAIKTLVDHGIIRKGSYNDNRFDRTNWYSFTEYGERLMEAKDDCESN